VDLGSIRTEVAKKSVLRAIKESIILSICLIVLSRLLKGEILGQSSMQVVFSLGIFLFFIIVYIVTESSLLLEKEDLIISRHLDLYYYQNYIQQNKPLKSKISRGLLLICLIFAVFATDTLPIVIQGIVITVLAFFFMIIHHFLFFVGWYTLKLGNPARRKYLDLLEDQMSILLDEIYANDHIQLHLSDQSAEIWQLQPLNIQLKFDPSTFHLVVVINGDFHTISTFQRISFLPKDSKQVHRTGNYKDLLPPDTWRDLYRVETGNRNFDWYYRIYSSPVIPRQELFHIFSKKFLANISMFPSRKYSIHFSPGKLLVQIDDIREVHPVELLRIVLIELIPCLGRVTVREYSLVQDLVENNYCPICYNTWEDDAKRVITPCCYYAFHQSDILSWIDKKRICPICLLPLEEASLHQWDDILLDS